MNQFQIALFITLWEDRFPNTDLTANLIKYMNSGDMSEYLRKFKDIHPDRCQLIIDVIDHSRILQNGDIEA